MNTSRPHRLMTPAEVAELLQISEKTVYKHRSKLCGFKPAGLGVLRFRQEVIYGIMEGQDPQRLVLQFPVSDPNVCRPGLQNQSRGQDRQRRKKKAGQRPKDRNRHGLF
ncbi:MAG TPA: hypothetical protein DHV36_02290 [Desulfobacteraceae bacterium]|nr:hypothetical protein [Desulfobacteraceae bacterium]